MKLYKYTTEKGIGIIRDLEIVVTQPNQFNDPFEFYPVITGYDVERDRNM